MSESATGFKRPYAKRLLPDERRRQILDVALPMYVEHGFGGTTVEEVGEKVGISKPVIYDAFESKEGLAAAVFEEAHRVETERHREAGVADSIALVSEGQLTPLYLTAFSVVAEDHALLRFLYRPLRDAPSAVAEIQERYFRSRSEALERFALEYFGECEDAAMRAHQLGRVGTAIGYLGLSTLVGYPNASPDRSERLARDYGRMLEVGIRSESEDLGLAGAVDPL